MRWRSLMPFDSFPTAVNVVGFPGSAASRYPCRFKVIPATWLEQQVLAHMVEAVNCILLYLSLIVSMAISTCNHSHLSVCTNSCSSSQWWFAGELSVFVL